ncbi:MAG: hypothetical protein K6G56_00620 [Clostridiales bacterium]|nr:hypothetical protein [Clostridiales bacterium]
MNNSVQPVKMLLINAKRDCAVLSNGGGVFLSAGSRTMIPIKEGGETLFTVWGVSDGDLIPVPKAERIAARSGRIDFSTFEVVDWGDIAEADIEPLFVSFPEACAAVLLDHAEYPAGSGRRAELWLDGGLMLRLGGVTIPIGRGRTGSLRVLDVGSARLLVVRYEKHEGAQGLAIFNPNAEKLLEFEADAAGIEEGYPTARRFLNTVAGHEKRTRWEYSGGAFHVMDDITGFFTREKREPAFPAQGALAFVQELSLGLWDEAKARLTDELQSELSEKEASDYLGLFDEARLSPFEEGEYRAVVGLIEKSGKVLNARRFAFALENGLIADITEL